MKNHWTKGMYRNRFIELHSDFLSQVIDNDTNRLPKPNLNISGRPSICYTEASERSKRRKVSDHLENHTPQKIIDTAFVALKPDYDMKFITDYMYENNLNSKQLIKIIINQKSKSINSVYQSLKILCSCNLSAKSYKLLRKNQKYLNQCTLQPYYKIALEKMNSIPTSSSVDDSTFQVDTGELLAITARKIIYSQCSFANFDPKNTNFIQISAKCGIDGAQSATEYCHKFSNEKINDKYFVISTTVLLSIKFNNAEIYSCPTPNSMNNARPIFFTFEQESAELTRTIHEKIREEIKNTQEFFVEYNGNIYR